jgi:hypothetical protein
VSAEAGALDGVAVAGAPLAEVDGAAADDGVDGRGAVLTVGVRADRDDAGDASEVHATIVAIDTARPRAASTVRRMRSSWPIPSLTYQGAATLPLIGESTG